MIGHPTAGITPKFAIKDANGNVFLIKLDPASIPELASSVELIATKIFHAIGRHRAGFHRRIDPQQSRRRMRIKTETGRERPMTSPTCTTG